MNISSETEGSSPKAVASALLHLGGFCISHEDDIMAVIVADSRRRFAVEITGDKEVEFAIIYPGDEEKTPVKISAEDMEEAIEMTGRITDRLLALSLNIVTITVIGSDPEDRILFETTFENEYLLPPSEEAGYQDLLHIFAGLPVCGCPCAEHENCEIDHDLVLDILQKFPNLASRTLDFEDYLIENEEEECPAIGTSFDDALPLSCLLLAPNTPSLEVVEAVYELNDEAVTTAQGNREFTALHFALLRKPCNALVEFLIEKTKMKNPAELSPKCATETDSPLWLVLNSIVNGRAESSILILLIKLCPDLLHSCCLLSVAMQMQCPRDTLKFLTARCVNDTEQKFFPQTISRRDVETIRDVLPLVTTLRVGPREGWLSGSLEMLLSSVVRGPSTVVILSLLSVPPSPIVGKLLKLVLERDSTLRDLRVYFDDEATDKVIGDGIEVAINSLLAGLCANKSLKTIGLGPIPRGAFWEGNVTGEYSLDQISNAMEASSLESVWLTLYPNKAFLDWMLALFPTVTKLDLHVHTVKTDHSSEPNQEVCQDLTEFLGSLRFLQQRHPTLNPMKLRLPQVPHLDDAHIEAVCDLLRQNSVLGGLILGEIPEDKQEKVETKLLGFVKETNDTLAELSLHRHNTTLMYFVALNEYGRKIARDNHTSKEAFVELLCKVIDSHEICFVAKHMIQYGLLHEKPGLWAN